MRFIPWSFPLYVTPCTPTRLFLFNKLSANERENIGGTEFKHRILIAMESVYVTSCLSLFVMTRRFLALEAGEQKESCLKGLATWQQGTIHISSWFLPAHLSSVA
jgi:hypothetical protein